MTWVHEQLTCWGFGMAIKVAIMHCLDGVFVVWCWIAGPQAASAGCCTRTHLTTPPLVCLLSGTAGSTTSMTLPPPSMTSRSPCTQWRHMSPRQVGVIAHNHTCLDSVPVDRMACRSSVRVHLTISTLSTADTYICRHKRVICTQGRVGQPFQAQLEEVRGMAATSEQLSCSLPLGGQGWEQGREGWKWLGLSLFKQIRIAPLLPQKACMSLDCARCVL